MNRRGFTLLELLIAITLMAFLSILTTQSIQRALKTRAKLQRNMDMNSQVRDALRVIERDVQYAFHHRDESVELHNTAMEKYGKSSGAPNTNSLAGGAPPPPPLPDINKQPVEKRRPLPQLTFFYGDENKLSLTTRTNARVAIDQKTSDQLRVSYYVEACKSRRNPGKSVPCLWRKTNPYFDDTVEIQDGTSTPLLEGVESLKFRYMGPTDQREWSTQWKSKMGDQVMNDKFPLAVEVTMTVSDTSVEKPKPITVQTVALVRFPNNKPKVKQGGR